MSSDPSKRPIRSFVIRAGRTTVSQRKALSAHWDDYVIPFAAKPLKVSDHFPGSDRLTVEIGFGMGDSLLEMAQQDPTANFLGIEVHRPGVGKLLHGITEHQVKNLKIICHDATEVIADCFPEQSIDNILVFFPDPWPKKRHHKRRIIQPGFVSLLSSRLKQGGHLHLATDWEQYAEHMMEVLEQETTLSNAFGKGKYYEDPARPQTKFENRGRRLGHGVWDLLFKRIG
ncbi:MAG TPA: tRNA (guanosine(46)-N7)-methyltransferase TrmB [Gammaproteobacteria bacterium]|nr:tRNA (guanosine(46)-N7)-methyltransferase TrmB [Gammaproteobacteria bacterium]|tara:strand:+ start:79 stop:765 length:687 start_codon:yes stop_codon:yes gene_type:complete